MIIFEDEVCGAGELCCTAQKCVTLKCYFIWSAKCANNRLYWPILFYYLINCLNACLYDLYNSNIHFVCCLFLNCRCWIINSTSISMIKYFFWQWLLFRVLKYWCITSSILMLLVQLMLRFCWYRNSSNLINLQSLSTLF